MAIQPEIFADWWAAIVDRVCCYREPSALTGRLYFQQLNERLTQEQFVKSAEHIFNSWEPGALPSPDKWVELARELTPVETYQLPAHTPPPISELPEAERREAMEAIASIKAMIGRAVAQSPYKSSVFSSIGDALGGAQDDLG